MVEIASPKAGVSVSDVLTSTSTTTTPDLRQPHLLIRNKALRHFWCELVNPHDSIRRLSFISKLSTTLIAPRAPLVKNTNNTDTQNNPNAPSDIPSETVGDDVLPKLPYGYGIPEVEVLLLLRGSPRGYLEEIMSGIDLDETGVVTCVKLDAATGTIPIDFSLRDTLLFLAYQGGRKIILPRHIFHSTELKIQSVLSLLNNPNNNNNNNPNNNNNNNNNNDASVSVSMGKSTGENDGINSGISVPVPVQVPKINRKFLYESVPALSLFSIGSEEIPTDNIQENILDIMNSSNGWNVLYGKAGVGKTDRVISASRIFLSQNIDYYNQIRKNRNKENSNLNQSQFYPGNSFEYEKYENIMKIIPSLLYINLSGCRTKSEVLSSLALQLGVTEGGGVGCCEETEQRVMRMIGE